MIRMDRDPVQSRNEAFIELQPGQILRKKGDRVVLKEPVTNELQLQASQMEAKNALITKALEGKIIAEEEAEWLKEFFQSNPRVEVGALQRYLKKRRILKEAFEQELIGQTDYRAGLDKLQEEIKP